MKSTNQPQQFGKKLINYCANLCTQINIYALIFHVKQRFFEPIKPEMFHGQQKMGKFWLILSNFLPNLRPKIDDFLPELTQF